MAILWQLRNPKTGENLNSPQPLPENWGPIFGLHNFKEKLNDLSWVGIHDKAWFEIGPSEKNKEYTKVEADDQIRHFLNESLPMVAADNTSITKEKRAQWIEYRRLLKDIQLQPDYPLNIYWPKKPD